MDHGHRRAVPRRLRGGARRRRGRRRRRADRAGQRAVPRGLRLRPGRAGRRADRDAGPRAVPRGHPAAGRLRRLHPTPATPMGLQRLGAAARRRHRVPAEISLAPIEVDGRRYVAASGPRHHRPDPRRGAVPQPARGRSGPDRDRRRDRRRSCSRTTGCSTCSATSASDLVGASLAEHRGAPGTGRGAAADRGLPARSASRADGLHPGVPAPPPRRPRRSRSRSRSRRWQTDEGCSCRSRCAT